MTNSFTSCKPFHKGHALSGADLCPPPDKFFALLPCSLSFFPVHLSPSTSCDIGSFYYIYYLTVLHLLFIITILLYSLFVACSLCDNVSASWQGSLFYSLTSSKLRTLPVTEQVLKNIYQVDTGIFFYAPLANINNDPNVAIVRIYFIFSFHLPNPPFRGDL